MDSKEKGTMLLSSTALCNLAAAPATDKNLYTVPAGKSAIITHVVMHTFSEDCTTAVVTFGIAGGAAEEFLGDQTLTGITASFATQFLLFELLTTAATPTAHTILTAGQIFAMQITTAGTGTCTIDVFGYLF